MAATHPSFEDFLRLIVGVSLPGHASKSEHLDLVALLAGYSRWIRKEASDGGAAREGGRAGRASCVSPARANAPVRTALLSDVLVGKLPRRPFGPMDFGGA